MSDPSSLASTRLNTQTKHQCKQQKLEQSSSKTPLQLTASPSIFKVCVSKMTTTTTTITTITITTATLATTTTTTTTTTIKMRITKTTTTKSSYRLYFLSIFLLPVLLLRRYFRYDQDTSTWTKIVANSWLQQGQQGSTGMTIHLQGQICRSEDVLATNPYFPVVIEMAVTLLLKWQIQPLINCPVYLQHFKFIFDHFRWEHASNRSCLIVGSP